MKKTIIIKPLLCLASLLLACGVTFSQQRPAYNPVEEDFYRIQKHYAPQKTKATAQSRTQQTRSTTSRGGLPFGIDPHVSFMGEIGSYKEWEAYNAQRAKTIAAESGVSTLASEVYVELEQGAEGSNDTRNTAEPLPNFGSGAGLNQRLAIVGSLLTDSVGEINLSFGTTNEDNGSIPLATALPLLNPLDRVVFQSVFGDGPHGAAGTGNGDVDYYRVTLNANERIEVTAFPEGNSPVRMSIVLFNENGGLEDFDFNANPFSTLNFTAANAGDYYFAMYDFGTLQQEGPLNPFVSGDGQGVGQEGTYAVAFTFLGTVDNDFYAVDLKQGDVFGIAIDARSSVQASLFLPDGSLGATTEAFAIRSEPNSPFPTVGQTSLPYVAPVSGTYTVSIANNLGAYRAELLATRPFLEESPGQRQVIYLDYTGGSFQYRDFFGTPNSPPDPFLDSIRTLSPFGDFLPNWGLENNRLNRYRISSMITREVQESLQRDFMFNQINPDFNVRIVSDYGDDRLAASLLSFLERSNTPYSRVIVGGTQAEAEFGTIGLASAIDLGNYSLADDSYVLLDLLSATEPNGVSLNFFPRAEGVPIERLIAVGVGNIVAHEAGHYLGNFHSDARNEVMNIMDEGGPIGNILGVPAGSAFGDANTMDVDFVTDVFSGRESFGGVGIDANDINTAYAMSFFPGRNTARLGNGLDGVAQNMLASLHSEYPTTAVSYPNPQAFNETSTLTFSAQMDGHAKVVLYDMQGKAVTTTFDGEISGGLPVNTTLDAQQLGLQPGFYVYKINTPLGVKNHKIMVQ